VFESGLPVEVQIRTELQDLWAQVFERLADRWGRSIRYGGEPDEPDAVALDGPPPITRAEVVQFVQQFSDQIDNIERTQVDVLDVEDDQALYVGDQDEPEYQALATDRTESRARLAQLEETMRLTLQTLVRYATREA
jgi:hypothetical protein